jgi:hypothetical protein
VLDKKTSILYIYFMKNETESASWPWISMLACGDYGGNSPAGKRYRRRAFSAVAVLAVATASLIAARPHLGPSVTRWAMAATVLLTFSYIFVEFNRYLGALDELARRLQMEAVLLAYSIVIVAAMTLGALGIRISPLWFVVAEPLRGLGLFLAARRYR